MMRLRPPSTVAALAAFALAVGTSANADIVLYSEDFSGDDTTNLHGTTPDTTIGSNTWIAHENWKGDGSIAGTTGNSTTGAEDQSAYLAFAPTTGKIYTLSATLDKPTGTLSGMWAAIGFTNDTLGTAVGNNGESFFAGTNAAGPWMLWRANNDQIAAFGGPGTANGSGNLAGYGTGPLTLTIVLDTTDTAWKAEWFVGNDSIYTFTYTTNPTISYIGLGRENNAAANFSSFSLSLTVIPEPSVFQLTIHPNAATAGSYDFEWASQPGKIYDLLTSTDLADPVSEWPVYDDGVKVYESILSAGETTTLTAVPSTDPRRFFALREYDAPPPPPLFNVNFEEDDGASPPAPTPAPPGNGATRIPPGLVAR